MKRTVCAAIALALAAAAPALAEDEQKKVPGDTRAPEWLVRDILFDIDRIQDANDEGNCVYELKDTRFLEISKNRVREEWVVDYCGEDVVYPIEFDDPENTVGMLRFAVGDPEVFDREERGESGKDSRWKGAWESRWDPEGKWRDPWKRSEAWKKPNEL